MVYIGEALQTRLIDVAKRQLGAEGEALLRETARDVFDAPLHQLTYAQLPLLFSTIEHYAGEKLGAAPARLLAREIKTLVAASEAQIPEALVGSVSKQIGGMARALLEMSCARLDLELDLVTIEQLPELAAAVRVDAEVLFSRQSADALAEAVTRVQQLQPVQMLAQLTAIATRRLGIHGEITIRRLCRDRLEIEPEDLTIATLPLLARIIEQEGSTVIGAARVEPLIAAARQCLISPAETLRVKVIDLVSRMVGPAATSLLEDGCARRGLPFQSVEYEHLMWLTEVVRAETLPLVGKRRSDDLAKNIRALLTGRK